jgi:CrcB protein
MSAQAEAAFAPGDIWPRRDAGGVTSTAGASSDPRPQRHGDPSVLRRDLLAIFIGGCVGALCRAALIEAFPVDPGEWPWATLIANVAGAFALGWVNTSLGPATLGRPLLGTGFCGAMTTFSALQLEVLRMLEEGEAPMAAAYLGVSVILGLAAAVAATALVRGRGGGEEE